MACDIFPGCVINGIRPDRVGALTGIGPASGRIHPNGEILRKPVDQDITAARERLSVIELAGALGHQSDSACIGPVPGCRVSIMLRGRVCRNISARCAGDAAGFSDPFSHSGIGIQLPLHKALHILSCNRCYRRLQVHPSVLIRICQSRFISSLHTDHPGHARLVQIGQLRSPFQDAKYGGPALVRLFRIRGQDLCQRARIHSLRLPVRILLRGLSPACGILVGAAGGNRPAVISSSLQV